MIHGCFSSRGKPPVVRKERLEVFFAPRGARAGTIISVSPQPSPRAGRTGFDGSGLLEALEGPASLLLRAGLTLVAALVCIG